MSENRPPLRDLEVDYDFSADETIYGGKKEHEIHTRCVALFTRLVSAHERLEAALEPYLLAESEDPLLWKVLSKGMLEKMLRHERNMSELVTTLDAFDLFKPEASLREVKRDHPLFTNEILQMTSYIADARRYVKRLQSVPGLMQRNRNKRLNRGNLPNLLTMRLRV